LPCAQKDPTLGLTYCCSLEVINNLKGLHFHFALGLACYISNPEQDRNKGSQNSLQVGTLKPQGAATFNVFKRMSSLATVIRYKNPRVCAIHIQYTFS